jgi:hypothetical protein
MSDKNKTVINQLYSYYSTKQKDGEWQLENLPMRESHVQGLALVTIADQVQRLVEQLRLPAGEWIEVTPETLPEAHRYCVLVMATGRKIFATGAINEVGEWYLVNFPAERPYPLFYMLLPDMTAEMQDAREAAWMEQAKGEEL